MGWTYGGKEAKDPRSLYTSCLDHDPTSPVDPWWGKANSFTSLLGTTPGNGIILMRLADVQALTLTAGNDLVISDGTTPLTFPGIIVRRYQAAVSGAPSDPDQPTIVWLTDSRWVLAKMPIDKAYNLRSVPGGSYYAATLNAGVAWTWQGMFANVWGQASGLGTAPTLPFTPDGTPDGFSFYGTYVLDALGTILDRLACALKYNPLTAKYAVVRLGATDANAANFLAGLTSADKPIWDQYATKPAYARLPKNVRVRFNKQPVPGDGTSPFYSIDVADTSPIAGAPAGSVVIVPDDLPAIYNAAGTLTNSAALTSRANERAADWFRQERVFNAPLSRKYMDVQKDALSSVGSTVAGIALYDFGGVEDEGGGLVTELVSGPIQQQGSPIKVPIFTALTARDDKSHSFSPITDLELHNATATQPRGASTVDFTVDDASATASGLVNLTAQTMGAGIKTFQSDVFTNSAAASSATEALNANGYVTCAYRVQCLQGGGQVGDGDGLQVLAVSGLTSSGGNPTGPALLRTNNVVATNPGLLRQYFDLRNSRMIFAMDFAVPKLSMASGGEGAMTFNDGVTGTGGGGDTFTGGVCTALGPGRTYAAINAAGVTQGTATAITNSAVKVTVPDVNNTGVIVPNTDASLTTIENVSGVNALSVYPPVGGTIEGLAVNAPATVVAGATKLFCSLNGLEWHSIALV